MNDVANDRPEAVQTSAPEARLAAALRAAEFDPDAWPTDHTLQAESILAADPALAADLALAAAVRSDDAHLFTVDSLAAVLREILGDSVRSDADAALLARDIIQAAKEAERE